MVFVSSALFPANQPKSASIARSRPALLVWLTLHLPSCSSTSCNHRVQGLIGVSCLLQSEYHLVLLLGKDKESSALLIGIHTNTNSVAYVWVCILFGCTLQSSKQSWLQQVWHCAHCLHDMASAIQHY